MKKRILSMLMVFMMFVGMLPQMAFADETAVVTETCATEGCEYDANHDGECSNAVSVVEPEVTVEPQVAPVEKTAVKAAKQAPVADSIVLETGDVATFQSDRYLSKIELKGISGTVEQSGRTWWIELPEDTDSTQPITVELTSAVMGTMASNFYFWLDSTCSESSIADTDPWTTTVVPNWENGRATLVACAGTAKKANGEKYTIELSIKGQTKEDFNTVKLEEDKEEKYFVKQIKLSGAEATAFSVSDTDYSNSSKNHKATVEYTLAEVPTEPVSLTFTMMDDSKSYMTCNGSGRVEGKGTHTATLDLTEGTVFSFVTYSSSSNSTVRGTYTIKFKLPGAANGAPVLKDAGVTEVEQTLTAGKSFGLDVASLFRDPEQEPMTYTVSINGAEPVAAAGNYSQLMEVAGDYTLVFRANDGTQDSEDSYTVKLKVMENTAPALTGETSAEATVMQYNAYKLDLTKIFADAEGDAMTYTVKVGDGAEQNAAANYSYTPSEDGTITLVFKAKDHALTSEEYTVKLTVTYAPRTTIDTTCTGKDTGDTWMKSVTVTGGEVIGYLWNVEKGHTESDEHILRIRLADTVADDAVLQLAYARGVKQSGFEGSVSGPATVTLADGEGSVTVKATGWLGSGVTKTYTIYFTNKANNAPVAASASSTVEVNTGADFSIDLSEIFSDPDGDAMTYTVTIGKETLPADEIYTRTMGVSGEIDLIFTATDVWQAAATHTVTVAVKQSEVTYDAVVKMPEGIIPTFYTTDSVDGVNGDTCGDELTAVAADAADGSVSYTVKVPENVTRISVRGVDEDKKSWGGMSFEVSENAEISVRQVKLNALDYNDQIAESVNTITHGENLAVAGEAGWLLVAGQEYICKAVPSDTAMVTTQETLNIPEGSGIYTVDLLLDLNNPFNIVVPTGAVAQLYQYNQYYDNTEFEAKRIKDNGDGTTTYSFIADTSKPGTIYRVTMDGKITKAGWVVAGTKNVTVTYSDSDKAPSYRLDDYTGTGAIAKDYMEDSVLLNINSRNHLSLSVGQTKTLKAYRAWEIIPISYNNWIIPPDFNYTILSGSDVVSLTDKASKSAGDGDWMQLTALKEGIAVIEVTYDAIDVNGGSSWMGGVYGASDPDRSGLVVVQVGGSNDTSVNFGIECYASAGKVGSSNVSYNPDSKKAWDAEFDTLYFTGSSGELKLSPKASSAITEVAVSHDKGTSWKVLNEEDGSYTAPIVSGNNILRVKTGSGTAYQVVRGDKISVSLKEVDGKSDGDGIVEAGETIKVSLHGLHAPIPKMAGNYNPGYGANSDGYSSQHLNYTANGKAIWGPGSQYSFITASNYVQIVMPEDGSNMTLTDGYIGLGVIGLTGFADGGDSHRNIPDGGCGTRGSSSTWHTRSVLPEITVSVGNTSAPNAAPTVRAGAVTEGAIYDDQKFALNPDTLFQDADGDTLTFTVSVNGGEATAVGTDYKFIPEAVGTYTLKFTASDGEYTAEHTVTVAVTERSNADDDELVFDINKDEIAGYVTISFEDNGVRVDGETGLEFPVPLGIIIEPTKVPYAEGDSIAKVTLRLLDAMKIGYEYSGSVESGFYLGAIKNFVVDGTPYDRMAEFDAGSGSGWMITHNDEFIQAGASEFTVKDGDTVAWKYTCQLGADIGDPFYAKDVDTVIDMIDAIGEVTLESAGKIASARAAYEMLDDVQKKQVSNYDDLISAEKKLAELMADVQRPSYEEEYKATGDALAAAAEKTVPGVSSTGGDWIIIGLERSGYETPAAYYNNVVEYVEENINSKEQLHSSKSTDNSRVILALTASGIDPTDVEGHNLLAGLTDMSYLKKQGINGPIWALIAFDSHDYEIPEGGDVTREALIKEILAAQLEDGGWTLAGNTADSDMTGMALQALAPYYDSNANVKAAVDRALAKLSSIQNADGTFGSIDGPSAESCAQVIVALTALGIDPAADSRFVKNGLSVIDGLLTFAVEGGGFKHIVNGKFDGMATEQGYYALVAYDRFLNGKTALYDMSDVELTGGIADLNDDENGDDYDQEELKEETKAETKSLTKSAKIKLGQTKASKAVISKINAAVNEFSGNAADLTDKQIQQITDIYKAYEKLSAIEKLAVQKNSNYKAFSEILTDIGRIYHYDKSSGIDVRDNDEKTLPWYIKLMAKQEQLTDAQIEAVKAALGDDSEVFSVNDIYFINTLDDSEWHPENTLSIKMPMVDIGDHSNAVIVHIDDEGKVEIISGTVEDGKIIFEAANFSLYGIAGTDATVKAMLASDTPVIWPWIAAAVIAVILLAIIICRRKKGIAV